jgi:hypothetical protein
MDEKNVCRMEMKEVEIVFAKILLCDMGYFLFTVIDSCGNFDIFPA